MSRNSNVIKRRRNRKARTIKFMAAILASGIISGAIVYTGMSSANSSSAVVPVSQQAIGTPTSSDVTGYSVGQTEGSVSQVAETAVKSLVTVSCTSVQEMQNYFGFGGTQQYEAESAGSGVIIGESDDELYIATNYHVIEGATTLSVGFVDSTAAEAYVKGSDPSSDLAVIAVPLSNLEDGTLDSISVAVVGDSDELKLGDQVVAIGNALGYGQSVTSGYVSAFDRSLTLSYNSGESFTSDNLIQTDASINAGNSGGGLFNMKGELIAINEAKSSSTESGVTVDNMGFAIPMSKATSILQDLINNSTATASDNSSDSENGSQSTSSGAYLGVSIQEVDEQTSQMYNMPQGVYITTVADGTPASQAGLMQGDVITAMDDTTITSYDDLVNALAARSTGDQAVLTVYRASQGVYQAMQVSVTF